MLLKDACPSHHALDKQHAADQCVLFLVLTVQAYESKVWGFVAVIVSAGRSDFRPVLGETILNAYSYPATVLYAPHHPNAL